MLAAEPVPAGRRRGRRLPCRHQSRGRVVPRARTLDGDGHHQCRHGYRCSRCAAAHRRHPVTGQLAMGLLHLRCLPGCSGRSGGGRRTSRLANIADCRPPSGRSSAMSPSQPTEPSRHRFRGSACCGSVKSGGSCWRSSSPTARGSSTRLAAEIPLRRARVRCEAGGLLRLDSLRRGRRRQLDWRMVLELAPDTRPHDQRRTKDCARRQRGGHAASSSS